MQYSVMCMCTGKCLCWIQEVGKRKLDKTFRTMYKIGVLWEFWVPERKPRNKTKGLWLISSKHGIVLSRVFQLPPGLSERSEFTRLFIKTATVSGLYGSVKKHGFAICSLLLRLCLFLTDSSWHKWSEDLTTVGDCVRL